MRVLLSEFQTDENRNNWQGPILYIKVFQCFISFYACNYLIRLHVNLKCNKRSVIVLYSIPRSPKCWSAYKQLFA